MNSNFNSPPMEGFLLFNDEHYFLGGLFPLPPPDGLPVLLGQFGLDCPVLF